MLRLKQNLLLIDYFNEYSKGNLFNCLNLLIFLKYGPRHEKNCLSGFANNKGADQPAHARRLISPFVIHVFESIIYRPATVEFQLSS